MKQTQKPLHSLTSRLGQGLSILCFVVLPGLLAPQLVLPAAAAQSSAISVKTGYELLEKGWANAAIESFREALSLSPKSVEATLGLAIAHQRNGQIDLAWQGYQQVISLDPNQRDALKAIGTVASFRLEWQEVGLAALDQMLEQQPDDWQSRRQRALLRFYQGQLDGALVDYEQLLAAETDAQQLEGDNLLGAAQVLAYRDRPAQALELFERYQQQAGDIPSEPGLAYAQALYKTGQADSAIPIFLTALETATPERETPLRLDLVRAYLANQQPELALMVLSPLRSQAETPSHEPLAVARLLTQTVGQLGMSWEQDPAISTDIARFYRQGLDQTDSPSVALRTEVADILANLTGEETYALTLYQALLDSELQLQESLQLPLRVKSLALAQKLGRICSVDVWQELRPYLSEAPATAIEQKALAQALIPLEPDAEFLGLYQTLMAGDVDVDADFLHFRIAQMQAQQGDLAEARQSLERYAAAKPGDPNFTTALFQAELHRRQGNFSESQKIYDRILVQAPNNLAARSGLGGLVLQQQELALAQQQFAQVLLEDPDNLTAQASLAEIKAAQGKPITALRELEQLAQQPCSPGEHCDLQRRSRQIRQRLHRQRGFQPFWERY